LDLRSNLLEFLPDWIGDFSKLEILYLQDNQLASWPASGRHLANLRRLELANNRIGKLPGASLPPQLKQLGLAGNRLRTLRWGNALPDLQRLYLQQNRLIRWPDWAMPSALTYVNLSGNALRSIPERMDMPSLEYLDLSNNRLEEVNSLDKLPKLQDLNLSRNRLSNLAPEIGKLTYLRRLDLSRNQLNALPVQMVSLEWLREVNLSRNRFSGIPSVLERLACLEKLDLSRNLIQGRIHLEGFQALQKLDLGHNQISKVSQLPTKISRVILRNNPMDKIQGLSGYTQLGYLDATRTQLEAWPTEIFAHPIPIRLVGVKTARTNKQLTGLLRSMPLSDWSPQERESVFLAVKDRDPAGLQAWHSQRLLQALHINARTLRDLVRQVLLTRRSVGWDQVRSLAVFGKLSSKQDRLTTRLAAQSIRLAPKAEAIVLGRPPYPMVPALVKHPSFFSESDLMEFLRSREMAQVEPLRSAQEEKLIRLLLHPRKAQVKLGLSLLQPQAGSLSVQAALLLAFKLQTDPALKKKLRKELDQRCSIDLWPLIGRPLNIDRKTSYAEKERVMTQWFKDVEFDPSVFLDLIPNL
jgi:Leucine-rich repeat (LRR) protein